MTNQAKLPAKVIGFLAISAFASACADISGPDVNDDKFELDIALMAADAALEDLGTWTLAFAFQAASAADAAGSIPGRPGGKHGPGHPLSGRLGSPP